MKIASRLALLVVFVAFGLRLVGLAQIDLGMDGGASLAQAYLGPQEIFAVSGRDVHPPLYYLLLHYWLLLAGTPPFAAKYLSVLFNTLTLALLYSIGCRLRHPRLGLLAAALMAISSIEVINTAAVRDFVAAGFFAVLSTRAFLGLLPLEQETSGSSQRKRWAFFVLASLGGLLTSYLHLGVLAAQAIYALLKSPSWRRRQEWLGGIGVIAGLYAPWGWEVLVSTLFKLVNQQAPRPATGGTQSLGLFAAEALRHLSANEFVTFDPRPVEALYLLVPLAGLVWVLLVSRRWAAVVSEQGVGAKALPGEDLPAKIDRPGIRSHNANHAGFLVLALVLSLALTYAIVQLWLHLQVPSRYLMAASPFFVLLVALGLDALSDIGWPVTAALLAVFAFAAALSLRDYHARPLLPPSMWNPQALVDSLDEEVRDSDGIIFITPEQAGYYQSLSKRPRDWYYFFIGPGYLEGNVGERVVRILPGALAKHDTLWLVSYMNGIAPSSQQIAHWLNQNAYFSGSVPLSDTTLLRYVASHERLGQKPVGANFGNLILLQYAGLPREVAAGGDVKLALTWQALGKVGGDYTIFTHLLDDKGYRWAQLDAPPQNGEVPTSSWSANQTIIDKRALKLPADLPPGRYWIDVGLYKGENRLDLVKGGSTVRLGPVEVR